MTDTPTTYSFLGPTQHRAARIPAAEWKKREARLRELHDQVTLSELMSVMKREGRTQYIYQLGKWGMQKYNTAKTVKETAENSGDFPGDLSNSAEDNRVTVSDHGAKRRRSIQTMGSTDSSSLSSLPSSSKKTKLDGEDTVPISSSSTLLSISPVPIPVPLTDGGIEGDNGDNHSILPSQSLATGWPLQDLTEYRSATATIETSSIEERAISNTLWRKSVFKGLEFAEPAPSTYIDASFDVLAYLHSMHPPKLDSKPGVRGHPNQSISDHMASVSCEGFVRFALDLRHKTLSENPTWYHGNPRTMVFTCVQSCLDWCATSVDATVLEQASDDGWLAQGSSRLVIPRWPQVLALFKYLYGKWHFEESEWEKPFVCWGWRLRTREKLGISAADLLMVCCDMITQACEDLDPGSGENKVGNFDGPCTDLRENIRRIQGLEDEELVTRFLQRLCLRTVSLASPSELTEDELHRLQSPRADQMDPPRLAVSKGFTYASSSHSSNAGTRYNPTIAPSLGSSNASYRRMREASSLISRRFTNAGSKASLAGRDDMESLAGSIDNMSDMMQDFLSISEAPVQEHLVQ